MGDVFVPSEKLDHAQQAKELCAVGTDERNKKQESLPEILAFARRKDPKFAPEKVIQQRRDVSGYIRSQIIEV